MCSAQLQLRGYGECASHVCVPSRRGQICLGLRPSSATKKIEHRQRQVARQFTGLIEAARSLAGPVERYGDDRVGALEYFGTTDRQEGRERPRDGRPAVVLERMNDVAERSFIRPDRAGKRNRRRTPAAPCAQAL
jgi:hypothetical protein